VDVDEDRRQFGMHRGVGRVELAGFDNVISITPLSRSSICRRV
jgi:hypothetical protein